MRRYTPEQHAFFREAAPGHSYKEIQNMFAERFGLEITETAVKNYLANHKLRTGTQRKYNQEHINWLRENIRGTHYKELTQMFNERFGLNVSVTALASLCYKYGLHNGIDSRLNLAKAGTPYRFQKGNIPFNKGRKGISYPGMEATQFKKGNRPHTWKPVGTETVRSDGYTWVKIAEPNKWREKHRIIWEAANGPVPKGHAIIFADGNKQNIRLENLMLVTRAQLARLNQNGLIGGSADLTRAGILVADIISKIAECRRGIKKE